MGGQDTQIRPPCSKKEREWEEGIVGGGTGRGNSNWDVKRIHKKERKKKNFNEGFHVLTELESREIHSEETEYC